MGQPMMPGHKLLLILLFAVTIAVYFYLDQTTPARLSSVIFFILICTYVAVTHRPDIISSCILFFAILDIGLYVFATVIPVWVMPLTLVILVLVLWGILFRSTGWILAIGCCLMVLELSYVAQRTRFSPGAQAFLVSLPFIAASQYLYFKLHRSDTD